MKTVAILCGGPPKPNRNRHLEIKNNKSCISHVIDACIFPNTKVCVVLYYKNTELKSYIEDKYKNVKILESKDLTMLTTFNLALNEDTNDTLIIAGDLWNINKDNVLKFLNSPYKSAMYRLKVPWGRNLVSLDRTLIRRGDVGDSLLLIAEEHKKEYLSEQNIKQAIHYFNKFYSKKFDMNWGNYLWTWMDYSFFFDISSSRAGRNNIGTDKGTIYIEELVYLDND